LSIGSSIAYYKTRLSGLLDDLAEISKKGGEKLPLFPFELLVY
jgi:hypothetical protein